MLPVNGPERLYISRGGSRKYSNEVALATELKILGFTIVDDIPRTAIEQIQLFKSAKIIIGPHGAGFGNLVFSEQASLFEFQQPKWVQPGFRYLCHQLGHDYHLAVSSAGRLQRNPMQGCQHLDIDIPVETTVDKSLDGVWVRDGGRWWNSGAISFWDVDGFRDESLYLSLFGRWWLSGRKPLPGLFGC